MEEILVYKIVHQSLLLTHIFKFVFQMFAEKIAKFVTMIHLWDIVVVVRKENLLLTIHIMMAKTLIEYNTILIVKLQNFKI